MIRFAFNFERSVQAMAFILKQTGAIDKVKLMKLIYLADREHLLQYDRTITGGRLVAMDFGPLPSQCLDIINGNYADGRPDAYSVFHLDDHVVSLKEEGTVGEDQLGSTDKAILNQIIHKYGAINTWQLKDQTHRLPEYSAFYQAGTSTEIPIETLLYLAQPQRLDSRNRITVSSEMAAAIHSPYDLQDDSDL